MGDAAVEFDEPVDGFGAAVVGAAGVEVGQEERFAPLFEGLPESFDLRDRERGQDLLGGPPALGRTCCVVGRAELLGALPKPRHNVCDL